MDGHDIKTKLLDRAEVLFIKYGIRSVSMDDIARQLSVSKKTLYQHFADKDELVTLMSQRRIIRREEAYKEIARTAQNAIDELSKISVELRCEMEEMNPSLLYDVEKFHAKAWALWVRQKHEFVKASIVRNINQGIDEGYFRPDVNPEIISISRLVLIEAAFDETDFPKDRFSLATVQSQLFDHFVYGICTDKGRKLYETYKEQSATHITNFK